MVGYNERFYQRYVSAHYNRAEGEAPLRMPPKVFLRFALENQGLDFAWLAERCDYANAGVIAQDTTGISRYLKVKLAALTRLPVSFWNQNTFDPAQAEKVTFDLTKRVDDIAVPRGSHTMALERRQGKLQEILQNDVDTSFPSGKGGNRGR